jgi:cytidyltransferase-like protein
MALQKLRDYFGETNREHFIQMLDNKVHVVEKLAASSFHVKRDDMHNKYYKSASTVAMDIVDRTIVRFYENAIRHFQGLSPETKNEMPKDWKFGFDYLTDGETPNFKYSLLPKNNLVLTHIQVLNPQTGKVTKVIRDTQVLEKWAKKLDVQNPPVVFEGNLAHDQKEELLKLLEMNDKAFEAKYSERSFTRDLYNIFNRNVRQSALNESLDEEIDGLIVSFIDGKSMKSFKLEDFRRKAEAQTRKASDMYQITILDLIEYFSAYDFAQHKLIQESQDRRYLELMSDAFNAYIKENAAKYIGVDFDKADFAKGSEFELNKVFIQNEKTLKLVDNKILAELFKIVLSSFRYEREKTTDILTEDMIAQMNEIVAKINKQVNADLDEAEVLDFTTFKKWDIIQQNKFSLEVNEALKVKYPDHGREKVNIFVGRFQPFTLGHAKVLQSLHDQNGLPVVVFLVKSKTAKKEDAFKRPYDEHMQMQMFKAVQKQYKFLKDIITVPFAAIDTLFNELRPKYEPVLWGTGSDRMASYSGQVEKESYREQLNVLPEFAMHEIHRTDDNISATKVRNAMLDDDFKAFASMTPKALHAMYPALQSTLKDSIAMTESVVNENIEVLTFEQFIRKS